ncbi:MAG: thioredoxin family protein, partial [Candidatus Aminicenantes bacterium]|nr:thioredoxin family protein [Candidatus Aminicenantes bacterium]
MKSSFTWAFILLVVLAASAVLLSHGKYYIIGECRWYTEQNDFPEVLAIAKKRAKPVLAVYSASWCGPCLDFIKNILTAKEFQKIEKEALLLFIEFTAEEGKKLVEKHKVSKFPTIKLFSNEGVDLETDLPGESVNSILQWVRQAVEKGKYLKRLGKNPADWEALFKATKQRKKSLYSSSQYDSTIALLRKALAVTGDADSLNRQRVYERLADYLYLTMINKQGERRRKYALEYNDEFTRIIRAYYPDKFRYDLKKNNPLVMWIDWLTTIDSHRDAITIFEDSKTVQEENFDPYENLNLMGSIIKSYLFLNQEKKAAVWLDKIDKAYENNLKKAGLQAPPLTYFKILQHSIEYTHRKNNR